MSDFLPPRMAKDQDSPPSSTPKDPDGPAPHLRLADDETYSGWDAIYADNAPRIYRLMYSKVGNRPDAEDLTAEVFRAALGPLRIASSRGEVRAYLLATARSVLSSHWRKRLGRELTTVDLGGETEFMATAEPHSPTGATTSRANQILAALPERYRRILELRFLEMCSVREAAHCLDVSVGNAKVLQHRALKMAANVASELDL